MTDQAQKTHRFSRWITEMDGGRPVRAYQEYADDIDGPWLGGSARSYDPCVCGHIRREHSSVGFEGCSYVRCECVSFARSAGSVVSDDEKWDQANALGFREGYRLAESRFRESAGKAAAERLAAGSHLTHGYGPSGAATGTTPDWLEGGETRPQRTKFGTPSRADIGWLSPAENAIQAASEAVEAAGASVALTQAVMLLQKAREKVADHYEGLSPEESVECVKCHGTGVPCDLCGGEGSFQRQQSHARCRECHAPLTLRGTTWGYEPPADSPDDDYLKDDNPEYDRGFKVGYRAGEKANVSHDYDLDSLAGMCRKRWGNALGYVKREGFAFDGKGGGQSAERWEKLAFSLYSDLCELDGSAAGYLD